VAAIYIPFIRDGPFVFRLLGVLVHRRNHVTYVLKNKKGPTLTRELLSHGIEGLRLQDVAHYRFNCRSCAYREIKCVRWSFLETFVMPRGSFAFDYGYDMMPSKSTRIVYYTVLLLPGPLKLKPLRLQLQLHLQAPPIDYSASHLCLTSLGILGH
jgi:hypothetical protein